MDNPKVYTVQLNGQRNGTYLLAHSEIIPQNKGVKFHVVKHDDNYYKTVNCTTPTGPIIFLIHRKDCTILI